MIKYPFLVGLRTSRPIARIESWLAAHCDGRWHVRIDEIAEDLSHKNLVIAFEKSEDRTAFKKAFAKSNAAQQAAVAEAEARAIAKAQAQTQAAAQTDAKTAAA